MEWLNTSELHTLIAELHTRKSGTGNKRFVLRMWGVMAECLNKYARLKSHENNEQDGSSRHEPGLKNVVYFGAPGLLQVKSFQSWSRAAQLPCVKGWGDNS